MLTVLVMPCLNEETTLAQGCASLGFGTGQSAPAPGMHLILVDNSSTDQTRNVMERIRAASDPGAVVIVREEERGYVPPRRRGIAAARQMAANANVKEEDVLILQGDADTLFDPGYMEAMRAAAVSGGRAAVFEAGSHPPSAFVDSYPGFEALANEAYLAARSLICEDADDVIIGDSVCGYWLSDYELWGGHRREYTAKGEEVHAETSRLFIRGKVQGARHCIVSDASAVLSRRKAVIDPVRFFSSAGFPRESGWQPPREDLDAEESTLNGFERSGARARYAKSFEVRRNHYIGLFGLLPTYVAATIGVGQQSPERLGIKLLLEHLPRVPCDTASNNPGTLLENVFGLIDRRADLFENAVALIS